jgi:hypothetical protein
MFAGGRQAPADGPHDGAAEPADMEEAGCMVRERTVWACDGISNTAGVGL